MVRLAAASAAGANNRVRLGMIGCGSTILPHLGNIAARVGDKLIWDAGREEITNSPEAARRLGRKARKPWDILSNGERGT